MRQTLKVDFEKIICDEFSYVLNKPKDEIKAQILEEILKDA